MRTRIFAALLLGLLSACASTSDGDGNAPWLRPSPTLRRQIDDQIEKLPWTHGIERIEQIQWFAGVGEPAYDALLKLCVDPRPDVAASAIAALGATGDSRLVLPLKKLPWPKSDDPALKYEKARSFLRLGDWSHIDVLIDGLSEPSTWARAWCAIALKETTRLDFGYQVDGPPEAQAESIRKWREWVSSRQGEGLVAQRPR